MKIACAQYPILRFASFDAWRADAAARVAEAASGGARLLVFPEYGGMALTALLPEALQRDLTGQIAALQPLHDDYRGTWRDLARAHGVHILAPSLPVAVNGRFHNRAWLCAPDGNMAFQDKRQMTRFESEEWGITGGGALKVFDIGPTTTDHTVIGVAICYDIEFPLIAHAMAVAGADLILAPSCTDTQAGSNRVHVGARARALESQVFVAVAPTVGAAPWSPAVDVNVGRAAVYAAPDRGLPDDGILALGEPDRPGWVMAELDFAQLRAARTEAQVFTRRDWPGQALPDLNVTPVKL